MIKHMNTDHETFHCDECGMEIPDRKKLVRLQLVKKMSWEELTIFFENIAYIPLIRVLTL